MLKDMGNFRRKKHRERDEVTMAWRIPVGVPWVQFRMLTIARVLERNLEVIAVLQHRAFFTYMQVPRYALL